MSTKSYRGTDGRYHFLYRTEHLETGDYYIGKHSTENLDDGYQGSGDWVKKWRAFEPEQLRTRPFLFFDSEEAAFLGEKKHLAEKLKDLRCQNINEGGDGRTSEDYPGYDKIIAKLRQTCAADQITSGAAWIGSPAEIIDQIRRTQQEFGEYEHASLKVNFNMVPLDAALASMRLFSALVMPSFTGAR